MKVLRHPEKNFSTPHLRSFVALQLRADERSEADVILQKLRSLDTGVKWEQCANLHITLRFLGDTTVSVLQNMNQDFQTECSRIGSIRTTFDCLGCFPNLHSPRIVWLGTSNPSSTLMHLGKTVETIAVSHGFEPEKKKFHPHCTLGRVKTLKNLPDLQNAMQTITFNPIEALFNNVSIMRSVLQPGGSVYTELFNIPLSIG